MERTLHAQLDSRGVDPDARTVPAVLSSEYPVDRGGFLEVLQHAPDSVDLSRAPLPVLVQHDTGKLNVGVVENLRVVGRKLRGLVRFGGSKSAREIFSEVEAGILRSLSIGYRFLEEDTIALGDTVEVHRWAPYEVSIVGVPADPEAGFNRNFQSKEGGPMDSEHDEKQSRSARRRERNLTGIDQERQRVLEIMQLGARIGDTTVAERMVRDGRPVDDMKEWADLCERQGPPIQNQLYVDLNASGPHRPYEQSGPSLFRAVAAQIPGVSVDAGFEREVSQELSRSLKRKPAGVYVPIQVGQRAPISKGGTGGNLVGAEHMGHEFVDVLRAESRVIGLGARVINQLQADLEIPRKTGGSNTFWVTEGSDVGEGGATFDNITMAPRSVGCYQDLTRKMVLQGSPESEQLIRDDLAQSIATEIDRVVIGGSGVGEEPPGILNLGGVGLVSVGANGGDPTWAHIVELLSAVSGSNAESGRLAYLTNSAVRGKLLRTEKFANTGFTVWEPGSAPDSAMMAGFPAAVSNNVPADLTKGTGTNLSAILFGNFADILIGHWGVLDVLVDPYTLGLSGGVRIRAMMDVDIALRHPESFAVITDAGTI